MPKLVIEWDGDEGLPRWVGTVVPLGEDELRSHLRAIHNRLSIMEGVLLGQVEDLIAAVNSISSDATAQKEAILALADRVEALGHSDPDLTAQIESLKASAAQLDENTSKVSALAQATVAPDAPPVGSDTTDTGTEDTSGQ